MEIVDVAVIGAGASGIGVGMALKDFGVERFAILEREFIGASFERWPKEMRFITPSFASNSFGMLDYNAVGLSTSPALTLQKEHPSGKDYAKYLRRVADHFGLRVWEQIAVKAVRPMKQAASGFEIETSNGAMQARFVIWAGGEFQYPNLLPFSGAEFCLHNSRIESWKEVAGHDFIVIGGGESGADAAIHLAEAGKNVHLLDAHYPWGINESDPSLTLSPFTRGRINEAFKSGNIEFIAHAEVLGVSQSGSGYRVFCNDNHKFDTPEPPILATGFQGSITLVKHLFLIHHKDGLPRLTETDESTITPGLFLVGPQVRHEKVTFGFIYQFRQRFAVVADQIARQLGRETAQTVTAYRKFGLFLDDLNFCKESSE